MAILAKKLKAPGVVGEIIAGLILGPALLNLVQPGEFINQMAEIGVILINLSQEDFTVNDGERIAQMIIARHEQAEWIKVETLDETERGAGGFGHSGV